MDCTHDFPETTITPFPPFPTEILGLIFDLACTDTGKTACTLSLVSSSVRAFTKHLLFRSIVACRINQIQNLDLHFAQDPLRPRSVRNIFLSKRGRDSDPSRWGTEPAVYEQARILHRIMVLVAPALESFFCIGFPITETPFPRLRELTVRGTFHIEPLRTSLPSLERLHLYVRHPLSFLENLSSTCPQLSHLKLSGFTFEGGPFAVGLKRAWGMPLTPSETAQGGTLSLSPYLRSIILQPSGTSRFPTSRLRSLMENVVVDLVALAKSEEARAHGLIVQRQIEPDMEYEQAKAD